MKTFIEFCQETKKELPVINEKAVRSGIAHWAYPDGYMRSHYSALYFTPVAADAIQKMGPKADEDEVDHGQKTYKHHERMVKSEQLELKEDWSGEIPSKCDICQGKLGKYFIDGATKMGPWANMCSSCFKVYGRGLGQGKGQKYDSKSGKKLEG